METFTVFGHCKHCTKEITYPHNKPKTYCSQKCYLEFESTNQKTSRGHMTRTVNNKQTTYGSRVLHVKRSGDPMTA